MYISELLLLRVLLNGRLDSLIQSQCNISEASQHLDVRVIFYYSLLTAFCGRGREITHLYKYSSLPLCQTAVQTAVMLSALLFDPFVKENKAHKDNLAACTSVYFRFP